MNRETYGAMLFMLGFVFGAMMYEQVSPEIKNCQTQLEECHAELSGSCGEG